MKTLRLFVLLFLCALAIAATKAPAPLQGQDKQVNAENARFGYLVSDTNTPGGALGNWCTQNSPASELIVLDTTQNSIGLDLGTSTTITSVTVAGWDTMLAFDGTGNPNSRWKTRLNSDNVKLYYSNDNVSYTLCSSYTTRSDNDTRMSHLPFRQFHFENLNIKARYIKVHSTLADKKWSWVNYQDRVITAAGPKIVGHWFPQRAAPKHRKYPWAADCLPFGSNCERGLDHAGEFDDKETIKNWFGITAYRPPLFEELTARLYEARILWTRIGYISQKYLQTSDGTYDFGVFDKVVDINKRHHLRMLASFHEPTTRSHPLVDVKWFRDKTSANWSKYQDFVTMVVNRYKNDVKFWTSWVEFEIPACHRVTGSKGMETGDYPKGDYPRMAEFVKLQKTVYDGIKAADPNAVVLNGGFCGWGLYFVERILSLGIGQYMDVCAFDPYSNNPNCVLEKMLAIRDMLDYYGYVDMPIWVQEVGWSSGPWPADVNHPLRVADEQTKARYLTEVLDLLLPHVQVFFWYASCERMADEKQRMFGLFAPFPDAEPPYMKENLTYTVYADYIKKWYKDHNIPPPPPISKE